VSTDLRRFDYALEPLRRRRQWELDALQAELGRVQREVVRAEELVERLRQELQEATAAAVRDVSAWIDPGRHPRSVGFLVQLRVGIEAGAGRVEALRAERESVRAQLAEKQQKLDVIERHREEAVAEFAQHEEARIAAEADRDWLARHDLAAPSSAASGGET
jgi:flagellar export protein FliJ